MKFTIRCILFPLKLILLLFIIDTKNRPLGIAWWKDDITDRSVCNYFYNMMKFKLATLFSTDT